MCFANVGLSISPDCVPSSEKLLRRLVYFGIYQYSLVFFIYGFVSIVHYSGGRTKHSIPEIKISSKKPKLGARQRKPNNANDALFAWLDYRELLKKDYLRYPCLRGICFIWRLFEFCSQMVGGWDQDILIWGLVLGLRQSENSRKIWSPYYKRYERLGRFLASRPRMNLPRTWNGCQR